VILRGNRSAGYGFVSLATADAAQQAVQVLDKEELDGRLVIVEMAKPSDQKDREREKKSKRRPGRRGGKAVPGEVSEAEANADAPKVEDLDAAESADVPKPKKKKKSARRGKKLDTDGAEVVQTSAPPAASVPEDEAVEAKKPRARKFRNSRPSRPAGEAPAGEPSKTMLFVANLGFTVDDAGLSALFTEAGIRVTSARVVRRRWQPRKSKGYGFVDVGSEEEQAKAIAALEGKDIGGRTIAVKIAVNPSHDESAANEPKEDGAADPAA